MSMKTVNKPKLTTWSLLVLFLSVYSVGALIVEVVVKTEEETLQILRYFDFFVCLIFLCDFTYRLFTAESKLVFMKWGWIDLISSIPTVEALRWGRLFRVFRILRAAKSLKMVIGVLYRNRAKGVLFTTLIAVFILAVAGAVVILAIEGDAEGSNITTAEDALWWTIVTITTVGYGDFYPVTSIGRGIAVILMIAGIGTFGAFTAFIASFFAETDITDDENRDLKVLEEIGKLNKRLDSLDKKIKG